MPKQPLGQTAQDLIDQKVEALFDKLKARYLGPNAYRGTDKRIVISVFHDPQLSLPGVLRSASALEGVRADVSTEDTLVKLARQYLDAAKERTKAQVLKSVTTFLTEAKLASVPTSVETVLGGQLSKVMGDLTRQVHTILDAETSNAKNLGLMDGITRVNAHLGIEDAVVYYIVVHDNELCDECKRIHLLDDGVTPRLWRMSSISQGDHR